MEGRGVPRIVVGAVALALGVAAWFGVRGFWAWSSTKAPRSLDVAGARIRVERADCSAAPLHKVYVTFVDGEGLPVRNLGPGDLRVWYDDEVIVPTAMRTIDRTGEPSFVVVVAPVAGVGGDLLESEREGLRAIVAKAATMPGSKVGVITYGAETTVFAGLSEPAALERQLDRLALDGSAAAVPLLEAVRTAIDTVNAPGVPDNAHKLVVVVSDGRDETRAEERAFFAMGLPAHAVIDIIGRGDVLPSNGTARTYRDAGELRAQFGNVADELAGQYVIVARSARPVDGKQHSLQVMCTVEGEPLYSNSVMKVCGD